MAEDTEHLTHENILVILEEVGHALGAAETPAQLFGVIFRHLLPATHAEGGSVWLLSADGQSLLCEYAAGTDADRLNGQSIAAPFGSAQPGPGQLPAFDFLSSLLPERRHLATPLTVGAVYLGILSLHTLLNDPEFHRHDLELLTLLAAQTALGWRNAQLLEKERRAREFQSLLRNVGAHFHSILDLDLLLPTVFGDLDRVLNAEGLSLWMVVDDGDLVCRQARGGASHRILGLRVPIGQGVVGLAASTHQPLLIQDAQNDPRVFRAADRRTRFVTRSLICAPMVSEGKALGAIQAINKRAGNGQFNEDDLALLTSLADAAALAIDNARLFKDLQSSYDATLDALASALETRDRETEGHSRRVVAYTARIARAFGLSEEELLEISRGALLHDVGKIGVPDAVLHKPGKLDADERAVIERHPQLGYDMLSGIPYLTREVKIVLHHQERFDGRGYPAMLEGEDIPIGARLFAVADTLDAITSDRPYRKSRSFEEAIAEIASVSGKQFDPQVVEVFLTIPADEWRGIRETVMANVIARRQQRQ